MLHCGDVVAPTTLRVLQKFELPVHVIHGNNTGDLYNMSRLAAEPNSVVRYHGQDAAFTLADRNLFLVHYPHYAHALACTGDYDLVCCGHDHKSSIAQVATVKGGHTWLINPGTVGGVGASAHLHHGRPRHHAVRGRHHRGGAGFGAAARHPARLSAGAALQLIPA